MRKNFSTALGLLVTFTGIALLAQAPAAKLEFEVASIKPAPPLDPQKIRAGKLHIGMSIDAARVDIGNLSLADLIRIAYRLKQYQLSGPEWMNSQRFDVLAKLPEGGSKDKAPEMLQALLADRFKLVAHKESKEHTAYALVVGKGGSKLKEAVPDTGAPPAADGAAPPAKGTIVMGSGDSQVRVDPNHDGKGATVTNPQFGQMKVTMADGGMMRMEFAKMSMPALADTLSRFTDRPVLDMTELSGSYQVALDLSMDEMRNIARAAAMSAGMMMPGPGAGGGDAGPKTLSGGPAEAASTPGGSSIFKAIQGLGLKMEPRKLPIEILVIDHLEKAPTEN